MAEEACCSNVDVKPKPKLKLRPKPKSKSKKSNKSITFLANSTVQNVWPGLIQESNVTLRPTGTPMPKLAPQKTSYAYESNSWISKNHYSLSSERLWKWKASAIFVVTALVAVLALVAARFMGRMVGSKPIYSYHFILQFIVLVNSSLFKTLLLTQQQRFKNARIIHSDLQAHGSTTAQDRGEFLSPYERVNSKNFSDTAIVHPNYIPF